MEGKKDMNSIQIKNSLIKKVSPEEREEQESILFNTNAFSGDRNKIDQNEFIYFQNGIPLNLSAYVRENYIEHSVHFYKQFFYQIADLFGLDRSVMDKYVKPKCVPRFINKYVYGRFPNRVLARIHERNPLMPDFSRAYKNFQFLTIYADNLLKQYINDAYLCMKSCKNYKEFREKFSGLYGIYNQTELFED